MRLGDRKPLADRFWIKVVKAGDNDCWLWTGAVSKGYGKIMDRSQAGELIYPQAHRVAYQLSIGPIPEGAVLDHLCGVPLCVNPRHLEPVTHGENIKRACQIGYGPLAPPTCKRGHDPAFGVYLIRRSSGQTTRTCRECHRIRRATYEARKRAHHGN